MLHRTSDPVENLDLENQKLQYRPGENISITAQGRPTPSFMWQNLNDSTTIIGSLLEITEEMVGMQSWMYMAENMIRGELYKITGITSFMVMSEYASLIHSGDKYSATSVFRRGWGT